MSKILLVFALFLVAGFSLSHKLNNIDTRAVLAEVKTIFNFKMIKDG